MSIHRWDARRDKNEPQLAAAARQMGWLLFALSTPCDFLGAFRGTWYAIEIKMPKGSFRPRQKEFMRQCDEVGAPVLIWRSIEDISSCSKC